MADRVAALVERGIASHPTLIDDRDGFATHIATILEDPACARRADTLHHADLALAYACARGARAAIELLEATVLPAVRTAMLARWDAATVDDALQQVRQRFIVGSAGERPQLLGYSGRGALAAWLRVAAIRLVLDARRRVWRELPLEQELIPEVVVADDPAREQRAVILRKALRQAIEALPSGSRALLRYYYSDGVGVEELGRIYHVHASTVSRRLAQARTEILETTRTILARELATPLSEVDSVLGLAGSLEVDLDSLLKSKT